METDRAQTPSERRRTPTRKKRPRPGSASSTENMSSDELIAKQNLQDGIFFGAAIGAGLTRRSNRTSDVGDILVQGGQYFSDGINTEFATTKETEKDYSNNNNTKENQDGDSLKRIEKVWTDDHEVNTQSFSGSKPSPRSAPISAKVAEVNAAIQMRKNENKNEKEGILLATPRRKQELEPIPKEGMQALFRLLYLDEEDELKKMNEEPYENRLKRIVRLPQLSVQVMVRQKAVLNQLGQLEVVAQPEFHLVQNYSEKVITPLRLYILRPSEDQERPMMPCANANFLIDNLDNKHGYTEPIRDRDKNWRELLWTTIAPALSASSGVLGSQGNVGERPRPAVFDSEDSTTLNEIKSPQSPTLNQVEPSVGERKVFVDGVLMNKLLILRQGRRLGIHGMVISVYGMGIAGRVFMKKHRFPRHLRIEAYCPRLQHELSLRVNLPDLEELFEDEIHLLNPGHKVELCERLLDMLWYDETQDILRLTKLGINEDTNDAEARSRGIKQWKLRLKKREARKDWLARISKCCINGTLHTLNQTMDMDEDDDSTQRRRGKPWLRLQRLIYSSAKTLSGYRLIITVRTLPRKASTYLVRAYDQQTSQTYEILVSTRELAAVAKDKKDPDLWDFERKKANCEELVQNYLDLRVVQGSQMALCIRGRLGIAGPKPDRENGLLSKQDFNKESAKKLPKEISDSLLANSQQAGLRSRRRSSVRRSSLFSDGLSILDAKVHMRDMGKGDLIYRQLRRLSRTLCIISCYWQQAKLRTNVYNTSTSRSHEVILHSSELAILLKRERILVSGFLEASEKDELATQICDLVVKQLLVLDVSSSSFETVTVNRQIYCRGHKIRDLRPFKNFETKQPGVKKKVRTTYCIVSVEQGFDWIKLSAFERQSCLTIYFEFSNEEATELAREFEDMEHLEREVQLSVIISSFVLREEINTQGKECHVLEIMDDIIIEDEEEEEELIEDTSLNEEDEQLEDK